MSSRAGSPCPYIGLTGGWHHFALALLFLALIFLFSCRAQASPQVGDARAESEIRAVAEAFRQAIVDKDGAAFATLFLDPSTATWVSVESDARLAAAQAAGRPVGEKVLVGPDRTPLSFIQRIVQSPIRHDETMKNLRIATDGDIASVHFDFAYLNDGQTITTSEEAWLLVRTADGWRIVSVVWSKR
ncbi:MAG: hypothetical protein DCF29_09675 [Alphaproteobacteria bacterium]|nr:MAG: hypothetical protein DCF29_09675 [Alphaproteobacteria bacterium]